MDRRQRKTREAIFAAFIALLAQKDQSKITVGEIIEQADVGRATFYAHFETKDQLLKELCEDLFCHIFDAEQETGQDHNHIFHCDAPESPFLHLFQHLLKNDNQILQLLSCPNNDLFLQHFKGHLRQMVCGHLSQFSSRKDPRLPEDFWIDHITSTFVETLRWWVDQGMRESPETITEFFHLAV
jgi:AcrR family transcriptional regulator